MMDLGKVQVQVQEHFEDRIRPGWQELDRMLQDRRVLDQGGCIFAPEGARELAGHAGPTTVQENMCQHFRGRHDLTCFPLLLVGSRERGIDPEAMGTEPRTQRIVLRSRADVVRHSFTVCTVLLREDPALTLPR